MSKNAKIDPRETNEESLSNKDGQKKVKPTKTFKKKYYEFSPQVRVCVLTRRRHWKSKNSR